MKQKEISPVQLVVAFICIILWATGLYLAFSASIILGAVALFFPPFASVGGLIYMLSGMSADIMKSIAELLGIL